MCFTSENLEASLLQTALKSDMSQQYACFIYHRNKLIASGFNYHTTHRFCDEKKCLL
jgi:hypothetical protein